MAAKISLQLSINTKESLINDGYGVHFVSPDNGLATGQKFNVDLQGKPTEVVVVARQKLGALTDLCVVANDARLRRVEAPPPPPNPALDFRFDRRA